MAKLAGRQHPSLEIDQDSMEGMYLMSSTPNPDRPILEISDLLHACPGTDPGLSFLAMNEA